MTILTYHKTRIMNEALGSPLQTPIRFDANAEWISRASSDLCHKHRQVVDKLVSTVTPATATFDNVLAVLLQHENETQLISNLVSIYAFVATDTSLRAAATGASDQISHCLIDCKENMDLFRLVNAVYEKQRNDPCLNVESRKALIEERQSYMRKGMALSLTDASGAGHAVADIARRLKSIESGFMRNLDEKEHVLWLTRHELAGALNDALLSLELGTGEMSGKLGLDLKGSQARWMLTLASSPVTRERIYLATRRVVGTILCALLLI